MSPKVVLRSLFCLSALLVFGGCADDEPTPGVPRGLDSVEELAKSLEQPAQEKFATLDKPDPNLPSPDGLDDIPKEGKYTVKFETTAGDFVVEIDRAWAPRGAYRFKELVDSGFYNDCRFFRVVSGFVVQFGMNGDPKINSRWDRTILDDPVAQTNRRGYVTFATSGPDSRTTQLFINLNANPNLDGMGFAPIGKVIEGLHVIDNINAEYAEQPNQQLIKETGNEYLKREFPRLDYIKRATLVSESSP
ncbi:MAG: peptidylprolyl isomerase [Planctomycetaceae bacterium]